MCMSMGSLLSFYSTRRIPELCWGPLRRLLWFCLRPCGLDLWGLGVRVCSIGREGVRRLYHDYRELYRHMIADYSDLHDYIRAFRG